MANYLDRLAEDIVTQQNQLSKSPFTAGGAVNRPSLGAMNMANMPMGNGNQQQRMAPPPMMGAPQGRPRQNMPPPPPNQGIATAMNRPAGAPRIPQTLRGGNQMAKSRGGYSNSFSGATARRSQERSGIAIEEKYAAEQKAMQLKAMDQRYQDFKEIYGNMFPDMNPDTLDAGARLVALGQDVDDVFPKVATKDERFKQASSIYGDAKEMVKDFNKSQIQFKTLNKLVENGWKNQGAGQVAALYTFIKELDPDSVVREGEVALSKSSQSFLNQLKAVGYKVTDNTLMSEEMYTDIVGFTQELNQIRLGNYAREYKYHVDRGVPWGLTGEEIFGKSRDKAMTGGVPAPTRFGNQQEQVEEAKEPESIGEALEGFVPLPTDRSLDGMSPDEANIAVRKRLNKMQGRK